MYPDRIELLTKVIQTIVSTNPLAASMSAANFRDPWEFDPERWMGTESRDILDASQPFSLGSRNCLGQRYAQLNAHIRSKLANTESTEQSGLDGNAHNTYQDSL